MAKWLSPRSFRFWFLVALLAYTLGGFFLAPWLVERLATNKVSELNRSLSFGDIKINPFLLTIQLQDTALHDSDGELLFSYDDYFLDLQTSSLYRRAWTFKEVRLSGLILNYERFAPGDHRFGRLIDAFPTEEEASAEVSSQGLPRFSIQKLQINEAAFTLKDHLELGEFSTKLGPINVEVAGLSTLPDEIGQQQAHIKTRAGGDIAWQGSIQLEPLKSVGKVTIEGRLLADFDHYLALFTKAVVKGEDVNVTLSYNLEQAEDGAIRIALENLDAQYSDWSVSLPGEEQPLLTLPKLKISGAELRWPEQELDVASITLDQPSLRLVREQDGSLNLDRLLADFAGEELNDDSPDGSSAPPDDQDAQSWKIEIGQFGINGASASFDDLSTGESADVLLQDVSLRVSDISNQDGASLPIQAGLALASGGTASFDGQAVLLPELSGNGQLKVDAVQLAVAQPWIDQLARVTLNSGALSLDGEVRTGPDQPGSFKGSVTVSEFDLTDKVHKEKLAGWNALSIDRLEADLAANTIKTSILEFKQLYGRLQIAADSTTNLDGLMIESAAGSDGSEPEESTPTLAITLAGMEIEDASLDFSDLTLPLPFATAIRSMDGTISTVSTNSEQAARVDLEGQVDEFGMAQIKGSLNVWDPTGFTDIQMTFRNLEMEHMTPYTIEFAGWEIDAGRMDLDLDYKVNKGQLNGANSVLIRELTVGDKAENPSGASLPLKFAVALLKDSNGVIDVDLPVEGDLNDPSFKIGGIVWKAIGNLLVKAVTAPFRLLGSLVGVDSEDFGTLHFSAGQTEISPPDKEQLVKLVDAMRQRPELHLEVAGSYVNEVDTPALQAQQVDQRIDSGVDALGANAEELSTVKRRQIMEQLLATSVPGLELAALQLEFSRVPESENAEQATAVLDETAYLEALRQRLIEAEPVGEAELLALAEARADAVMAAIAGDNVETPLPVMRLDASAVEPTGSSDVPLELKVEASEQE